MPTELTIVEVDFQGDQIESAMAPDGTIWVPVKRICENLGIDAANQRERIKSDPKFSWSDITLTARDGKRYEMICLSSRDCHAWLLSINSNKVREDIAPKLLAYQRESMDALDRYWRGETVSRTGSYGTAPASHPQPRSREIVETSRAYRALVSMGKAAGLTPNQAAIAANNYLRKTFGVDCLAMLESSNLVCPVQEKQLRPSELGILYGGASAQDMNKLLVQVGLQETYRDHKNRLQYRVTDLGKPYAIISDTGKRHSNGTPVQQILWLEGVVSILKSALVTTPAQVQ